MGEAGAGNEKQFKRSFDTLHSLCYFVPEVDEALTGAGLRPGRMCYFAGRSAAMGAVGPGVVAATFYNFNPAVVAKTIPRAWTLASPEQVVEARFAGVDKALTRLFGDDTLKSDELAEAAELAREATAGCTVEGRPLYAGHADLPWPDQPHLVLWHAVTLLREYRGDGHIAALVLNGLGGLDALVTHVATGKGFVDAVAKLTRGWSDEQWDASVARLREQGILGDEGLTEQGTALRDRVEVATEAAATGPWDHLGPEKTARLEELCRPLGAQVVAAGAYPEGIFNQGRP